MLYGILLQNATGVLVGGRAGLGNAVTCGTWLDGSRLPLSDGSGLCVQGASARSVVQGNLFNGNAGNGITLRRATGLTLSDNIVFGNGGMGLSADSLAGIAISGNLLSRNGLRSGVRG